MFKDIVLSISVFVIAQLQQAFGTNNMEFSMDVTKYRHDVVYFFFSTWICIYFEGLWLLSKPFLVLVYVNLCCMRHPKI